MGAINWEEDHAEALARAQQERKYLLLYFHKPN
jgi:hypothetical protein